ncbi:hypothetical protein FBU30_010895 [Linnemannia zychae]|nr:hypothetical protein FBU30_010895 [Linnemannia zychae]
MSPTEPPKIDSELSPTMSSAIENFIILTKACGGSRRIAPLSPLTARYILFPMRWKWPYLKARSIPSQEDSQEWLTTIAPGRLIAIFLTDVGLPAERHNKSFDCKEWHGKGYVIHGAVRTNGQLLQLFAFKIKELQSVRYCRDPKDKSLKPLVTTIGVTDVTNLLASDPSQVAVLSLDLEASCLLGATVSLPPSQTPATLKYHLSEGDQRKMKMPKRSKRKPGDQKRRRQRQKMRKLSSHPQTTRHFEFTVKRNAVSQLTRNFSSWLENHMEKSRGTSSGKTIQELESTLPPPKSEGAKDV